MNVLDKGCKACGTGHGICANIERLGSVKAAVKNIQDNLVDWNIGFDASPFSFVTVKSRRIPLIRSVLATQSTPAIPGLPSRTE